MPDAAELVELDLAELCSWAAELAGQTGAASRAVELARRAIALVGERDPRRSARLHESLGRCLYASGRGDAALAAFERAVEIVPAQPPSPERAEALAALGNGLMLAWRYDESLAICEQALALARAVGAHAAELRALTVIGTDLAYLGRGDKGLAQLRLALRWEHRWTDVDESVRDGLARARSREMAQIRVWLCAKGLRAQAELAALARARRDDGAVRDRLRRARSLLGTARRAATDASAVTPNAAGWRSLAEAEHERANGVAQPELWSDAADVWERLERAPLAAYCRWRQAEALVAAGAPRTDAAAPLHEAYAVAARVGARPLLRELELLAERAPRSNAAGSGLGPRGSGAGRAPRADAASEELFGFRSNKSTLVAQRWRETEVLTLVARGLTNREIAATLVISVKTAGVHVSHILRRLDAPNRLEAGAIAHRIAPPRVL